MLGASRVNAGLLQRLPVAMAGIVIVIGLFTVTGRATVIVGRDMAVVQNVDQSNHKYNKSITARCLAVNKSKSGDPMLTLPEQPADRPPRKRWFRQSGDKQRSSPVSNVQPASEAAASVGIAVHNSAEASLAAAPVYLAQPGLGSLLSLIEASRQTCRVIKTNFAISLGYNALGASLAMLGVINPLVAAVLMPISSLTVVSVSLRAGRVSPGMD